MRVKCLAQKHNTMSPARARTRTARSGDECTNHEATTTPFLVISGLLLRVRFEVVSCLTRLELWVNVLSAKRGHSAFSFIIIYGFLIFF